jgi:hypothetical protein
MVMVMNDCVVVFMYICLYVCMFVCLFVCLFVWWCGARVQVGARLLGVESRQPTLASCRKFGDKIAQ